MRPVIFIPARLASTRLPEKPLALIAGEPMVVQVWRRAVAADIGPVFVACDDARIAQAVAAAGGKALLTRADHPSGSDRIFEALCAIDPQRHYDVIVNVQGDVPTIEPETVRAVLAPLAYPDIDIATLACEIKNPSERRDPAVVKPVLSFPPATGGRQRATALYFSRATVPLGDGPLHHHIGIYAYRRAALETFVSLPPGALEMREKLEQLRALEAGMRIGVALVDAVPLGVDTPEHLEKARRALEKRPV
jgi:3-deoxy-manno-octulosonate cytidylyltransferase (CMP-KDO synthetase)